jgi:hypothetical protein
MATGWAVCSTSYGSFGADVSANSLLAFSPHGEPVTFC